MLKISVLYLNICVQNRLRCGCHCFTKSILIVDLPLSHTGDRRGRDRMVVGFTTTYAISAALSPLMLRVRISIRARCTTICDKVCQGLATGLWFSLGPLVFSTNKTDRHDITEILLKVALKTIKQTNNCKICVQYQLGCG